MRWKAAWRLAMIGAAMALSAGIAAGGVGDLEHVKVPLTSGVSMMCAARRTVNAGEAKEMGLKSPKAALLQETGPVRVALDAETAGGELNVVRVDTTGTGSFKAAVVIKSAVRKSGSTSTYGRIGPQVVEVRRGDRTVPVTVFGHYHGGGSSISGGVGLSVAAEGSCAFGNTTRKVRIVDGDGNLSFGDVAKPPFTAASLRGKADMVFVADKDGQFAAVGDPPALLGQPVQVDGAWYIVSVDGLKVSAAASTAGTAKVTVGAAKWLCTLAGEKYFLTVSGGREPVELPADSYRVQRYRLSAAEEQPGLRGPTIYGYQSEKAVDLPAGRTTRLGIGSPIRATIAATKNGGNVQFSLSQTDAAGSRIGTVMVAGGKRPPNPEVEVVNGEGSIVYTAKLEYG
ncbi:MAG: hypothetical protein WBF17_17870 [Phycisphaerae bacterium]